MFQDLPYRRVWHRQHPPPKMQSKRRNTRPWILYFRPRPRHCPLEASFRRSRRHNPRLRLRPLNWHLKLQLILLHHCRSNHYRRQFGCPTRWACHPRCHWLPPTRRRSCCRCRCFRLHLSSRHCLLCGHSWPLQWLQDPGWQRRLRPHRRRRFQLPIQ